MNDRLGDLIVGIAFIIGGAVICWYIFRRGSGRSED